MEISRWGQHICLNVHFRGSRAAGVCAHSRAQATHGRSADCISPIFKTFIHRGFHACFMFPHNKRICTIQYSSKLIDDSRTKKRYLIVHHNQIMLLVWLMMISAVVETRTRQFVILICLYLVNLQNTALIHTSRFAGNLPSNVLTSLIASRWSRSVEPEQVQVVPYHWWVNWLMAILHLSRALYPIALYAWVSARLV